MANRDSIAQFTNQAQDISRSVSGAFQGFAEVQSSILQRLGGIQQDFIQQASEAASAQLQVMSKVRDPRKFAAAQAELVKTHGQRYVDSLKQVIDVTAEAWQEYADRAESTTRDVTNKVGRATGKAA